MTIAEQIRSDMKDAMKNKESERLTTLRGLISAFMNEMVANGGTPQSEVTDEVATVVIKRAVKQRKDAIEQFTNGGRDDLAENEKVELAVLEQYLPEMMSEDAIREIAMAKKAEMGVDDKSKMGMLVGAVMKECAGNADGGVVKQVVESLFE